MHTPSRPAAALAELRPVRVAPGLEQATVVLSTNPRRGAHGTDQDPHRAATPRTALPARPHRDLPPQASARPAGPRPRLGTPPRQEVGDRPTRHRPAAHPSSTGCTVALRLLRPSDPQVEPVFVDGSGRRRLLLRALGVAVAVACLTYLVLVVGGVLAGPPHAASLGAVVPPGVSGVAAAHLTEGPR